MLDTPGSSGSASLLLSGACAVLAAAILVLVIVQRRRLRAVRESAHEQSLAFERERARLSDERARAAEDGRRLIELRLSELEQEAVRVREHYEAESRRSLEESLRRVAHAEAELAPLRALSEFGTTAQDAQQLLQQAEAQARSLRAKAEELLKSAELAREQQRAEAAASQEIANRRAAAIELQASADAERLLREARATADAISAGAYAALDQRDAAERALRAIRNTIDGYGDRYVVPTRSLLDDLAADFSHVEAGQALGRARERSRQLVEAGEAAICSYVEQNRREAAIRFVTDAFNGRVDAIVARAKDDNFGTLAQQVRDAFVLVNMNGQAFRDACITETYLRARLEELRWATVAQELRQKERDEQKRIKDQMREEERARREYEKAIREAATQEQSLKEKLERAREEAERASLEERSKLEARIEQLHQQLLEAEARNARAVSMAQQTRAGHVYVISNPGSFGENVFKIGMTRRLEPMDRVKELGDASVPFEFDVHAMIYSEDAPTLERFLHNELDDLRINKVNFRKEFFRVPLQRIREVSKAGGHDVAFTELAHARDWRETQAIERLSPEERIRYYERHHDEDDATE